MNTEYPLYAQENADKCPTARYVGGVSRWLCECLQPAFCPGSNAVTASRLFTRDEYVKGHCTHDQYYSQFLSEGYVNRIAKQIGQSRIASSQHAHFNDIPLQEWDRCGVPADAAKCMRLAGDFPTLAGGVCLAKAAAKQIRRENANPRKWAIKVSYRLAGKSSGLQHFETLATGTVDGILDYYMADPINVGSADDVMANVQHIEFTQAL